jgi:hypothetical protein
MNSGELMGPEVPTMPTEGLVIHYPFDNSFEDQSPHGFDAMNVGDVDFVANRSGQTRSAAGFGGQEDYLWVPFSPALNIEGTEITLAGWVNATAWYENETDRFVPIMTKEHANDENVLTDFDLMFTDDTFGFWPYGECPASLTLRSWHFFAVVVSNGRVTFRLDDQVLGTRALATPLAFTDRPLHLGANFVHQDEFLVGALDDIRIYDRALSAEEVQLLYEEF